jgi:hypothetical protein
MLFFRQPFDSYTRKRYCARICVFPSVLFAFRVPAVSCGNGTTIDRQPPARICFPGKPLKMARRTSVESRRKLQNA